MAVRCAAVGARGRAVARDVEQLGARDTAGSRVSRWHSGLVGPNRHAHGAALIEAVATRLASAAAAVERSAARRSAADEIITMNPKEFSTYLI